MANDYVIKNIRIFHKFLLNFGQILSMILKIFLRIWLQKLGHINIKYFS